LTDAIDGGHENDSEEAADVEDEEFLSQVEGKGEKEKDGDREEDVSADLCAGVFYIGSEVFGCGRGQRGSPGGFASGAGCWMLLVCSVTGGERECGV
jgi:hypothetical protein